MAMTDLTIIARSMTGRLFSTLTTVATVAVAVALMVVLLAMRDAGERAFARGSGNMHLVVSQDSGPLEAVLNNVFHAGVPKNSMTWSQFESTMMTPRPPLGRPVISMVDWAIPLQTGDSYAGFPVVATSGAIFTRFEPVPGEPMRLASGRFFESPIDGSLLMQEPLRLTYRSPIKQAVVGAEAARGADLSLGDRILMAHGTGEFASHIHAEDAIEVVGILAPTGTAHDRVIFIDLATGWLLHARDFHEAMAGDYAAQVKQARESGQPLPPAMPALDEYFARGYVPRITGVYMRAATRPGSQTSAMLPPLLATLRADPTISAVASPTDQIQGLFRIVGNINQILVAMAGVVILSSGIAIMLALYNSMEQRRRQIAVLRVLGASKSRIFGLIVTESALLGMIGSAVGLVLAWGGGVLVAGVMARELGLQIEPSLWVMQEMPGQRWSLPLTPVVVLGTITLAALAGLVPAVMAYRTSVARNLRPLG